MHLEEGSEAGLGAVDSEEDAEEALVVAVEEEGSMIDRLETAVLLEAVEEEVLGLEVEEEALEEEIEASVVEVTEVHLAISDQAIEEATSTKRI